MANYPGDTVSLSVVIARFDRRLDPSALSVIVTDPSSVPTTFVYGTDDELLRDDIGKYRLEFDVPSGGGSVGLWTVTWTAVTDITQDIGDEFVVDASLSTVTVVIEDAVPVPVEGVVVTIVKNDVQYGTKTTDAAGEATFRLTNGTYKVIAQKDGWQFAQWSVTVAGDTSTTLTGTYLGIDVPPTVATCRVYGFVYDGTGKPVCAAVHVEILGPTSMAFALDGAVGVDTRNVGIVRGRRSMVARADTGFWEVDLVQGIVARLFIPALKVEKTFRVPVAVALNYVDLRGDPAMSVEEGLVGNGTMRV